MDEGKAKKMIETDLQLNKLNQKLKDVKGSECEVYTRIVGYHRNLKNWNRGKREEYKDRKVFKYADEVRK